jgi:hypothetical protein
MPCLDYISYFRSLVENDPAAQHWNDWWAAHGPQMATLVSRGMYLRLTAPASHTKYMAVFSILEEAGYSYPRPFDYVHAKFWEPDPVPIAWLVARTTFEEIEARFHHSRLLGRRFSVIKEIFRPGDEVWTFRSPDRHWAAMMGRQGFAFLRDGIVYAHLITSMN